MDKEQLGSIMEMMRDEMIDAHAEMTVSTEHLRAVLDALEAALARAAAAEVTLAKERIVVAQITNVMEGAEAKLQQMSAGQIPHHQEPRP